MNTNNMNSAEYARYLGISMSTLRKRLKDGSIVASSVTSGGHRRYSVYIDNVAIKMRLLELVSIIEDGNKYSVTVITDVLQAITDNVESSQVIDRAIFDGIKKINNRSTK
jgi:hypothetical protein